MFERLVVTEIIAQRVFELSDRWVVYPNSADNSGSQEQRRNNPKLRILVRSLLEPQFGQHNIRLKVG